MSVALTPAPCMLNPHQSVSRRRHIVDGKCRTVTFPKRRQSIAAMQSNTIIPPTPCKSKYARGKSGFVANKRLQQNGRYNRSITPSPNKKYQETKIKKANNINLNKSAKKCKFNNNDISTQSQYFQNLGLIGMGSSSHVYKVQNAYDKKIFAIKKSSSFLNTRDAVTEALNEVEIIQMLHRQNDMGIGMGLGMVNEMEMETKDGSNDDEDDDVDIDVDDEDNKNEQEETKTNSNFDEKMMLKHIVKLGDFWISYDRQLYQLYEYYQHGTLLDIIEHNNRLNYLQILIILKQICNGLALVHSSNIIHLDLKPTNIFITKDYVLKIGDFGISINLNKHNALTPQTKSKQKCRHSGDPIYIAPELMGFNRILGSSSESGINKKTDIFSLGIILLELLCDIKAPSQGIIFQNLRHDIIDFNIMEPSPMKSAKYTQKKNKQQQQQNQAEYEIIQQIGNDMKCLCISMLQQKSTLRPNCHEISIKIDEILNNDKYKFYLHSLNSFNSLSLPPETVIHDNLQNNNKNNNGSHFNSNSKIITDNIIINNNDVESVEWFYQQSPKCYKSLFCFPPKYNSPSLSSSSISICHAEEFQLNLTSAFESAIKTPLNGSSDGNNTSFRLCLADDFDSNDEGEDNDDDDEDFEPTNLLASFM